MFSHNVAEPDARQVKSGIPATSDDEQLLHGLRLTPHAADSHACRVTAVIKRALSESRSKRTKPDQVAATHLPTDGSTRCGTTTWAVQPAGVSIKAARAALVQSGDCGAWRDVYRCLCHPSPSYINVTERRALIAPMRSSTRLLHVALTYENGICNECHLAARGSPQATAIELCTVWLRYTLTYLEKVMADSTAAGKIAGCKPDPAAEAALGLLKPVVRVAGEVYVVRDGHHDTLTA
ncbi:hypothetical protein C8Q73DRAFT_485314 [Cubamyces lactineus]|nr:hypothetical protein C8Q73DRAFT_485314 [Cubamyces lactineus]